MLKFKKFYCRYLKARL